MVDQSDSNEVGDPASGDERLRADAEVRALLVASNVPAHTIAALYPIHQRVQHYLKELCKLEPWVDVLPTQDPEYWKRVNVCEDSCGHPVHAFGNPERLRHLVEVPPFRPLTRRT